MCETAKKLYDEPSVPDGDLVRRWKKGDPQATVALVRRYEEVLFGFLLTWFDQPTAEDVSQETWMSVTKDIHKFEDRGIGFAPFLFRIAVNKGHDYHRRQRKYQNTTTHSMLETSDENPGPSAVAAKKEMSQLVIAALTNLCEDEKYALISRFYDGLRIDFIGQKLDISNATVHRLLKRAKERIRKVIGKGEISL